MSGRSHLSIGDVLTLLRDEFPDVTISKIRFLESQGLVNPERSPSGYRKFYEQDVERLRWVLRQQREHFLPLKVIRDRLVDSGGELPPDVAPEPATAGEVEAQDGALDESRAGQRAPEPALVLAIAPGGRGTDAVGGTPVRSAASTPATASKPATASTPGPGSDAAGPAGSLRVADDRLPGISAPPVSAPPVPAPPGAGRSRDAENGGGPPAAAEAEPSAVPPAPGPPPSTAAADPEAMPGDPAPAGQPHPSGSEPVAEPARDPAPARGGTARAVRQPPGQAPPPVDGEPAAPDAGELVPPFAPTDGVSGASLTIEELCAATGLAATDVASLESLGLVDSVSVAGVACYDESALAVASLVSQFGRYGIEPRHLRLYRNAAEREAGLVEQIVMPLLRQRNPEARRRAVDSATDLAALGQRLRAALLRRELRRLLG